MKNIYRDKNSIIFKSEYQDFETGHLLSPVETQNFTIIQVADSYYEGSFCIPEHRQLCDLEITYSLSSTMQCSQNGIAQKVQKYNVCLSYKDELHELTSKRGCRFQTLAINVKNGNIIKLLDAVKEKFASKRCAYLKNIEPLLTQIVSEFISTDSPFYRDYLDSLIVSVLVNLARLGFSVTNTDALSTEDTIPAIINYIDSNFLGIYSLEELAGRFGYNYNHICKTFKKVYGITPSSYLISKKMDYACELLKSGMSVKTISEKLAYSTPYNFSRAFKQKHGISPTDYLKGGGIKYVAN